MLRIYSKNYNVMSEKELSKDESLELITEMINQAKRNLAKGGSFHFLLWGWVVMLANLGHYILAKYNLFDAPQMVWLITIPASIVSIVYSARKEKNAGVKSHIDRLNGIIWLGIFIGVLVILFFLGNVNETLWEHFQKF